MNNIISMKKVNKFYDDFHVLKEIDFSVKKGEIVVICGPSGSGKSTLIRCINGLEDIDDGEISVDNLDIHQSKNNLQTIRSEVGMVFQHFNLFPHLTIRENITLAPGLVKNIKRKEAKEIAMALLKKVKLEDKDKSYPADLSGGQKQRVAIARSLAMKPKIILFDEPTSALDNVVAYEVMKLLIRVLESCSILLITHDKNLALWCSDKIINLNEISR